MPAPTIYGGLAAYWKFDQLVSGDVDDSSLRSQYGVLANAGLVNGGKFGDALRTTSSGGLMTVEDMPSQRQSATSRISVNVWINLDKALDTMWGTPVFCDKTGGTTAGYFLGVLPGGGKDISFRIHNAAGTPYTATYTENATSGWVMITGVYEGGNVRIYRNAVSQATAVADGTITFAVADIEIGEGFEGLIDEMSIWTKMLTSGEVSSLYAAGTGLELVLPFCEVGNQPNNNQFLAEPYDSVDHAVEDLPADVESDALFLDPEFSDWTTELPTPYIDAPYFVVDSPKKIFVDPNPVITSLTIDNSHHAFGVAEAGPTDAFETYNYWEIELEEGVSIVVIDQRVSTNFFEARTTQEDDWFVPAGSDWKDKRARFVIQAVQDSSQIWYSDWVNTVEEPWRNVDCSEPEPEPPVWPYAINSAPDLPLISPVSIDLYNVARHRFAESSALWPLDAIDIEADMPTDDTSVITLMEDAPAGLYRMRYEGGARLDDNTGKYNKFFPGAFGSNSKGLWIQSDNHPCWYVFQSPAFSTDGYDTEEDAEEAAEDYEFIFFHKGGDLSLRWDMTPQQSAEMSGTISVRVRSLEAENIPGKWSILRYDTGKPVFNNDAEQFPRIVGLGLGLTHVRYFLDSVDKKPRWQDFYIRVWPTPGKGSGSSPKQNKAPAPTNLLGSGTTVKERRTMNSKTRDGNQGASTSDSPGPAAPY